MPSGMPSLNGSHEASRVLADDLLTRPLNTPFLVATKTVLGLAGSITMPPIPVLGSAVEPVPRSSLHVFPQSVVSRTTPSFQRPMAAKARLWSVGSIAIADGSLPVLPGIFVGPTPHVLPASRDRQTFATLSSKT